jgi:hypothetical protein
MSEKIINAAGGFAAPEEVLEDAALEKKSENDPCWDGYVRIGMKRGKDGEMVPNCVPIDASNDRTWANYLLSEELEELADHFNSDVGPSRFADFSVVEQVANRAAKKYSYLKKEEIRNAIKWDVYGFLEYSSLGLTASAEFDSEEYSDLLNEGHPYNENPPIESYAKWISGAPGLDESSREAIYASIIPTDDQVATLHASTRVKALLASGQLPKETVTQIKEAILWSITQ